MSDMYRLENAEILEFMKSFGPCVVTDIRKKFNVDSIIIGAYLSDLIKRKYVKITRLQKGTSPFYYLPGQEEQLEKTFEYLHEKDRDTIEWLKQVKVVDDSTLDLFKKVSLRKIVDFAIPLKGRKDNGEEVLFWRYFLFSEADAIKHIRNLEEEQLKPKKVEEKKVEVKPVIKEEVKVVEKSKEIIEQTKLTDVSKEILPKKNVRVKKDLVKPESKNIIEEEIEKKEVEENKEVSFSKTAFYQTVISYFEVKEVIILKQLEIVKNKEYEFLINVPSNIGNVLMLSRAKFKAKLNESDVAPILLSAKTMGIPALFVTNGDFTKKSLDLIKKTYTGLIINKL
jgi:hypothetical protein